MKSFKHLNPKQILKIAAIAFAAILVVIFIISLAWSSVSSVLNKVGISSSSYGGADYGSVGEYKGAYAPVPHYNDDITLSKRNVGAPTSVYPVPTYGTSGDTAEDFEVTDYSAYIESRNKEKSCATVINLKQLDYVVFENSNESDDSCAYTFKVKHEKVGEILNTIKTLDPKSLTESTYTIKSQVDDFTSETEILQKKLESIDATLESALDAYDEITALAKKSQDVSSLTKIIDSRIQIIERLTQERINITEQLDRLSRSKADQLDRLEYTYFNVTVVENKYIDGTSIKDSWKSAVKNFFQTINEALQAITVGFVGFLFVLLPIVLYFFVLLLVIKYGWKAVRNIWYK